MFYFILALLGTAGVFFFAGATRYSGWSWSYEVCQQGAIFCEHPGWILIAAGVAIAIEMMRMMSKV